MNWQKRSGSLDVDTGTSAWSNVPVCHRTAFPPVDLAGHTKSAWMVAGDRGQMNNSQIHNREGVVFSNSQLRCGECSLPARTIAEYPASSAETGQLGIERPGIELADHVI